MSKKAFENLRIVRHPLLAHEIGRIRDVETPRAELRRALSSAAGLVAAEATRDLPTRLGKRTTPVGRAEVAEVTIEGVTLVPVLRAGLGMLDAFLALLPGAAVGPIGLERDARTREPREYYAKLPEDPGDRVFVLDPTVATGGSAAAALDRIREAGVAAQQVRLASLFVAPEGVEQLLMRHPEVLVFAAVLDERLDDEKQIVPGLGDAGDRLFGTD